MTDLAPDSLEWLAALRERLLAIDPDIATDEALFFDTLDGETDVLDKLRAIMRHGIEAAVFADALDRHIKVLEQRRDRFHAREDAARQTVREAMEVLEITKLTAPDFTASVVPGRPRVIVTDLDALPAEFVVTKRDARLSAIAAILKVGGDVPGAMFSNAQPTLTVRRI